MTVQESGETPSAEAAVDPLLNGGLDHGREAAGSSSELNRETSVISPLLERHTQRDHLTDRAYSHRSAENRNELFFWISSDAPLSNRNKHTHHDQTEHALDKWLA